MLPSWLWAVQAAWKSGNVVDYARVSSIRQYLEATAAADSVDLPQLEAEHRMQPLAGVIASLTHFARGESTLSVVLSRPTRAAD